MSQSKPELPLSPSDEQIASPDGVDVVDDEAKASDASGPIEDGADEFEAEESDEFAETETEVAAAVDDLTPAPESALRDSYLEDDEEWAAAADQILHQDEDTVIAQQEDAVVSWDIQGLYDENGKVRSKRSLRNNPPMLVISDSLGENATFVLTKDLAGVLSRHFDNTYRAYYGIRPKSELTLKEKLSDAKTGLRENMGKAIVVGGLLLGLLIFGFIF